MKDELPENTESRTVEGLYDNNGLLCADCGLQICDDKGPKDGWQLEDGRTVCNKCCISDLATFSKNVVQMNRDKARLNT